MTRDLLKELANETNQAILSLLAIEPTYTRSVAELLSLSESDASRRLTRLEEAGLVASSWERLDGKNVKVYRLLADEVTVAVGGDGIEVEVAGAEGAASSPTVLDRLQVRIPDPGDFVGRREELAALAGPASVVAVEGIAGIGKTSLLAAFARSQRDQRPVFFHGFTGTESLTWLAHRLGVFHARHGDGELLEAIEAGVPVADRRELVLQALEDPGTATVLDAVERIRDEDLEALIADAIERVREGKLVVAGRSLPRLDPTLDHVRRLRLDGLTPGDVAEVLAGRDLAAGREVAERVARRLGGHPLAINLLVQAADEAGEPVAELLEKAPDREVEAFLLAEVHERLSEPERRVLAYASVFHGPFTREDLQAVYPGNPEGALVDLERSRLLRRDGETYRVHDLLAAFFRERLEDPETVHEQAAERALARDTLEARLDALYHLLEAGKRSRVLDLLDRDLDLAEFDLVEEGYHNLYLDVLQRLDPDRVADEARAGRIRDELGDVRLHRGEPGQALAHYREAAEAFAAADAGDRLADLAWKRALALRELGRQAEAARVLHAGLEDHEPDERTEQRLRRLAGELGLDA